MQSQKSASACHYQFCHVILPDFISIEIIFLAALPRNKKILQIPVYCRAVNNTFMYKFRNVERGLAPSRIFLRGSKPPLYGNNNPAQHESLTAGRKKVPPAITLATAGPPNRAAPTRTQ
jgi:hypothetical protein